MVDPADRSRRICNGGTFVLVIHHRGLVFFTVEKAIGTADPDLYDIDSSDSGVVLLRSTGATLPEPKRTVAARAVCDRL